MGFFHVLGLVSPAWVFRGQGDCRRGLRVAVHHLGPFLLGPKETRQAMTGLRRARNGKDEEQSGTSGKHRV
jgi:hypothetical protein